jgi:hypothetical protein
MKNIFYKVVKKHNELSDRDIIWFPFMFLKPEPNTPINRKRILAMTACFSLYGFLALLIKRFLIADPSPVSIFDDTLLNSAAQITFAFFLWFEFVTSKLWNIRARALNTASPK